MLRLMPLLLLAACTTPDVMCGMRADYPDAHAFPESGEVTVRWGYNKTLPPKAYGATNCFGTYCFLDFVGPPGSFNDICSLAHIGHEMGHAMEAPNPPWHQKGQ